MGERESTRQRRSETQGPKGKEMFRFIFFPSALSFFLGLHFPLGSSTRHHLDAVQEGTSRARWRGRVSVTSLVLWGSARARPRMRSEVGGWRGASGMRERPFPKLRAHGGGCATSCDFCPFPPFFLLTYYDIGRLS